MIKEIEKILILELILNNIEKVSIFLAYKAESNENFALSVS